MKDSTGDKQLAERLARAEARIEQLATAAQVSSLETAVKEWRDASNAQHAEIVARLFGPAPASIQSQLNIIEERAFGDSPVSLRSRITQAEKLDAVRMAKVGTIAAILSGGAAFVAVKARDVALWFAHQFGY